MAIVSFLETSYTPDLYTQTYFSKLLLTEIASRNIVLQRSCDKGKWNIKSIWNWNSIAKVTCQITKWLWLTYQNYSVKLAA